MKLRLALVSIGIATLVILTMALVSQPLVSLLLEMAKNPDRSSIDARSLRDLGVLSGAVGLAISVAIVYVVLVAVIGRPLLQRERAFDLEVKQLQSQIYDERSTSREQLERLSLSNASLLRAQTELVSADRLATVGKLAAGVAHEVGNPLSGILGYLSLLKLKSADRSAVVDVAERIEVEVQRIDQIVRSLLELGRPSRGRAAPIEVRSIVESCVRLLQKTAEFETIEFAIDGDAAVTASAESGPLAQIVINLLRNAAQAMKSKGRIQIRMWMDAKGTHVSVRDEGPGLPVDVMSRLFEPFFSTRPPGEGTGLGLAVSKHLAMQQGGTLSAANAAQGGAVFQIDLQGVN